jgi:hypothetical protein
VAAGCEDAGEVAVMDGSACAAVAALGAALDDAASVFGVEEDPAMPAAYAVMCVRTSINFARVASSIVALDDFVLPLVPVAPAVDVGAPADVSLPAISVMILSIAATSVPQLLLFFVAFVDLFAVPPVGCVVLALGDEPIFSRLLK